MRHEALDLITRRVYTDAGMSRPLLASAALLCLTAVSCELPLAPVQVSAPPGSLAAVAAGPPDPSTPVGSSLPAPVAPAEPAVASPDARLENEIARYLATRRTGLSGAEVESLARAVVREARARDLEPLLVLAVVEVESSFDNFAVSPAGAFGLMQIRPATGEALAQRLDIPWQGATTLFDPVANVRMGVAYLEELLQRFDDDLPTALAAYNFGPSRIDRCLRRGCPVPVRYSRRVLESFNESAESLQGT